MRTALVTGAARGIGAATVRRLVETGHHVVALDWCAGDSVPGLSPQATRADLESLASAYDGQVLPLIADVREPTALTQAVDLALERAGQLDVVVAAAAVITGGSALWETDPAELDLMWDIDVLGVWNTAVAAVPALLANPDPAGCRFVAVASSAAQHGLFHLAGYTAAKHAVAGMVKALAADLAGTGVTACAISPGSTATAMLQATATLYDVDTTELASHQLLRRTLTPDEIAATIAFACSLEGAAFNGSIINADGGFTP
ncbi:MAG TPA: mycofactocin-coupled SDR family oxidoreductase [Nocardioides sp.]